MKTALITGSARGIGKEYARQLAQLGYHLVLVDLLEEELSVAARELESKTGATVECLVADLSTPAGCEQVQQRINSLESLDVLINNAGLRQRNPFPQDDLSAYRALTEVNIVASVHLAWVALRKMQQQGHGHITNVSALIGFTPAQVNYTMYSASKQFLINFTKGIYRDAKRYGVSVQAVCPGFTLVEGSKEHSRRLFPRVLWMTTEQTVSASLAQMTSGKCLVIPGARNRLLLLISRLHLAKPFVFGLKLFEKLHLLPRWDKAGPAGDAIDRAERQAVSDTHEQQEAARTV